MQLATCAKDGRPQPTHLDTGLASCRMINGLRQDAAACLHTTSMSPQVLLLDLLVNVLTASHGHAAVDFGKGSFPNAPLGAGECPRKGCPSSPEAVWGVLPSDVI